MEFALSLRGAGNRSARQQMRQSTGSQGSGSHCWQGTVIETRSTPTRRIIESLYCYCWSGLTTKLHYWLFCYGGRFLHVSFYICDWWSVQWKTRPLQKLHWVSPMRSYLYMYIYTYISIVVLAFARTWWAAPVIVLKQLLAIVIICPWNSRLCSNPLEVTDLPTLDWHVNEDPGIEIRGFIQKNHGFPPAFVSCWNLWISRKKLCKRQVGLYIHVAACTCAFPAGPTVPHKLGCCCVEPPSRPSLGDVLCPRGVKCFFHLAAPPDHN